MQRFEGEVVNWRFKSLNMQVFKTHTFSGSRHKQLICSSILQWRIHAHVFYKTRPGLVLWFMKQAQSDTKSLAKTPPEGRFGTSLNTFSAHAISAQTCCKLHLSFCNTLLLPFFGLLFLAFLSSFLKHLIFFSLRKTCFISQINDSIQI